MTCTECFKMTEMRYSSRCTKCIVALSLLGHNRFVTVMYECPSRRFARHVFSNLKRRIQPWRPGMNVTMRFAMLAAAAVMVLPLGGSVEAQQNNMSFFVTSAGSGKGADLGGLEGADRHCQTLAAAAGAGNKTWRAYLS